MHNILKTKARNEQPVLLVYHPIAPGREKQNIEGLTALETTRWTEKASLLLFAIEDFTHFRLIIS